MKAEKNEIPEKLKGKKIAIVHDWLNQLGGAENVLRDICDMFPEAPVYVLVYSEKATQGRFKDREIRTSWLQKLPRFMRIRGRKFLLPFCANAAENLDLRGFDLIISTANPWVKGIIVPQDAIHVSYLHAATRFLWDWKDEYLEEQRLNLITKFFVRRMTFKARKWDQLAAQRPDYLLANSKTTAQRVKKYYQREAKVVYPGVKVVSEYKASPNDDGYFFIISRLSPYKKIDTAVRVFNELGWELRIAGDGSARERLEDIAGPNVKVLGRVSEEQKRELYENCRGFINLTDDDFGITTVEAQAAGKPVVALRAGGSREIVTEGESGVFFDKLSDDELKRALEKFELVKWDTKEIKKQAEKYSQDNFKKNILDFLEEIL